MKFLAVEFGTLSAKYKARNDKTNRGIFMKTTILSLLMLISFSALSSEVGQKAKPDDCAATAATNKREPKKVVAVSSSDTSADDKKKVIGK
jgi:hypothetical protein